MESIGSFCIMSSASGDRLSYFLTYIPFVYFYYLTVVFQTPISISNKSRESESPCHILGIRRNGLKYVLLSIVLSINLIYTDFLLT